MLRDAIKKELDERGWSISKLSEETGIRYPSLTEYLKGNKDLEGKNIEIILKKLFMENLEKKIQVANAKLHKAYLRTNNIKTFDMRDFEFFDKGVQFTKIKHLLRALEFANLTDAEKEAKILIESQNLDKIENGWDFGRELLRD